MDTKFTALVRSRGFSITRLSKESGVPLTTVAALGRGERELDNMTVGNMISIAFALELSIEEIYFHVYADDPGADKCDPGE